MTSDGRLGVYRTEDAGKSWELASNGLPDQAWVEVVREGMASDRRDPVGILAYLPNSMIYIRNLMLIRKRKFAYTAAAPSQTPREIDCCPNCGHKLK